MNTMEQNILNKGQEVNKLPENYTVIDNLSNGYISDHFGIMTDISL